MEAAEEEEQTFTVNKVLGNVEHFNEILRASSSSSKDWQWSASQ